MCAALLAQNVFASSDDDDSSLSYYDAIGQALYEALSGGESLSDEVITTYNSGMSKYRSDDMKAAIEAFDKAYTLIGTDEARKTQYKDQLVKMYPITAEYYHGLENYTEAAKWWRKSAVLGDAYSQHVLGFYYEDGIGVEEDYDMAISWYLKSAEQGYSHAQYLLGFIYINKDKGHYNPTEAFNVFKKAAEQDSPVGQYMLSYCYLEGIGVSKNSSQGLVWLRKAADNGNETAIEVLKVLKEYEEEEEKEEEDNNNTATTSTFDQVFSASRWSHSGTTRYVSKPTSSYMTFVREKLKEWKEAQNGAITESGAGVAIYDSYGYAYTSGTPSYLKTKLESLNDDKSSIVDVNISENNNFVIIYDANGYYASGVPQAFLNRLSSCNSERQNIRSATFNDGGDWIIITDSYIYASNDSAQSAVTEGCRLYGQVYSAYLTYYGFVSCHERGVYYLNIPSCVKDAIDKLDFQPVRIKFTDNGMYLITDDEDEYDYFL